MKILIKLCVLCLIIFCGVTDMQAQLMNCNADTNMSVTYIGKQGSNQCYDVKMTTTQPVYSIIIKRINMSDKVCGNTTSCQTTVCFQGVGYEDRTDKIECYTKKTASCLAIYDGCTVTIGPK